METVCWDTVSQHRLHHNVENYQCNWFDKQLTNSKTARHYSTRETQLVSRKDRRMSMNTVTTFSNTEVKNEIDRGRHSEVFGPDIFHILTKEIMYPTPLFKDSVTICRVPAVWKSKSSSQSRNPAMTEIATWINQYKPYRRTIYGNDLIFIYTYLHTPLPHINTPQTHSSNPGPTQNN